MLATLNSIILRGEDQRKHYKLSRDQLPSFQIDQPLILMGGSPTFPLSCTLLEQRLTLTQKASHKWIDDCIMASVFGIAVTTSTLEGMPEYIGKTITQQDLAREALNLITADNKRDSARQFVDNLKASSVQYSISFQQKAHFLRFGITRRTRSRDNTARCQIYRPQRCCSLLLHRHVILTQDDSIYRLRSIQLTWSVGDCLL